MAWWGMTDVVPTMQPKQMAFFSDWFVEVRWPDGQKEKVSGFSSEHHALGWIEHESPAWLAAHSKAYRPRRPRFGSNHHAQGQGPRCSRRC